jgi:hypothetical protein
LVLLRSGGGCAAYRDKKVVGLCAFFVRRFMLSTQRRHTAVTVATGSPELAGPQRTPSDGRATMNVTMDVKWTRQRATHGRRAGAESGELKRSRGRIDGWSDRGGAFCSSVLFFTPNPPEIHPTMGGGVKRFPADDRRQLYMITE